jgi:hypothetical protein
MEAHASDEWPIRTSLCIPQHKSSEERCDVAKNFIEKYSFQWNTYVDSIQNNFNNKYASWPLRAYVIENGCIKFILQPKSPGYYDLSDLATFIKSL